jgi:hypothetical protein
LLDEFSGEIGCKNVRYLSLLIVEFLFSSPDVSAHAAVEGSHAVQSHQVKRTKIGTICFGILEP